METNKENVSKKPARAVQIVRVRDDSTLELDEEALKSVLLQEPFKDMPVVVVSVAGKYRQGKSFLLGFFLRYLQAQGSEGWLEKSDSVTDGFQWKAGPVRCTTGILIWSEPLIVSLPNGEKVAVLLMDTQGTDDIGANIQQDVPIFALSALLSSVLVFNVRDVGNNDLDSLRLFLEYGGLAAKSGGTTNKPFQDLHFLVRDWNSSKTHGYGFKGGEGYFKHITDQAGGKELRDALWTAFSKVSCFLMPHPGMTVASDEFEGHIADVDRRFLEHLRQFVPMVLGSENLVVKEDVGKKVTMAELLPILNNYFMFFEDGRCPAPETLYNINTKKSYMYALDISKKYFDSELKKFKTAAHIENLEVELQTVANSTRETFLAKDKLGQNPKHDEEYMVQLNEYIDTSIESRINVNEAQKLVLHLEEQSRSQAEKANSKIKSIEQEIEQMKENEIKEKEAKRQEIKELKKLYKQENVIKQREIDAAREQSDKTMHLMAENQKLATEKAVADMKTEMYKDKMNDKAAKVRQLKQEKKEREAKKCRIQ